VPVAFTLGLSSPPAGVALGGPGTATIYPGTVPGPSVSSVSSVSGNEGTSLVHTVTLSAATTASAEYAYSLGGGTSTSVSDYTVPPTFSAGVTLSGGTLTVPSGVSSFTVTVAALTDGASEGSETYNLTVGGVTGVGTINNVVGGSITPALTVEYVDASGVRQSTSVVSGVTSISGVAPFMVLFDASGTRSVETSGDDKEGAVRNIGYRINYGEALGTTWSYPEGAGYSMDEDLGPPVFSRAFTNVGTNNVRLRCKDSAGNEATISFDVVVAAHTSLTTVNKPVSDGSWGTLSSSRCYTLDAGGDYTAWGTPNTNGLHNVIFAKTGSGADPIISTFRPDSRNYGTSITRAAAIRTYNVDVGAFDDGGVGFDHCSVVNGRCRTILSLGAVSSFYFNDRCASGTLAEANSIRRPRGFLLWNCGEITNTGTGGSYVLIGVASGGGMYGVDLHRTANPASNEHVHRGIYDQFPVRYTRFRASVATQTWSKMNGLEVYGSTNGNQPDLWTSYDYKVGDYSIGATNGIYGYPGHLCFNHACQFGASGDTNVSGIAGPEPQNNDIDGTYEGLDLCGFENCWGYRTTSVSTDDEVHYGGRNLFVRNFKRNMGAGTDVSASTHNLTKVPPGWSTGYLNETTNTRPVPTAF